MKTFIVQFLAVAALVFLSACASDAPKTSSSTTTTDQSTTYHSPTTSTTTTDTQTK
jgi:outer membrane biogenesis lipoprotein LolB